MYSKEQIINRIDNFKNYAEVESTTTPANWDTVLQPLYNAVDNYFKGNNYSEDVNCLIQNMYVDILRRCTKYENDKQFDFGLSTDYPKGYDDISVCFYDFSEIMNISNETILNSYVIDITTMSATSTLVDGWITSITTANETDKENLNTLSEWCKNSGSGCDLVNLLENRGQLVGIKSTKEIATIIYHDRKLLDVIKQFNLTSYIPTYFKGDM
jgi:hypothetical protein